jgi:hypothetical protein
MKLKCIDQLAVPPCRCEKLLLSIIQSKNFNDHYYQYNDNKYCYYSDARTLLKEYY